MPGHWSSILVTLDGSELSESALAPALNTARLLNGQITLLHEEKHYQSGQGVPGLCGDASTILMCP